MFQSAILFSIPWSIAGIIDADSREKFDKFFKDLTANRISDHPIPESIKKIEVPIPEAGLVYDYCYEVVRGRL